jgi:hypothetical protein
MTAADRGGDTGEAALDVRATVGRLNDVIHAATIARALPVILQPGEVVTKRPSLAAGNRSRPFDVETDKRVAEFNVSAWKGKDAMRKQGVFEDLMHLALDDTGRLAQLFVVGSEPGRFLRNGRSPLGGALGRSSPNLRRRLVEAFGDASEFTIASFTAEKASHVEVVDLTTIGPELVDFR